MRKCINCNNDIEVARLDALPETDFCIKCAKKIKPPRVKERFSFSLNDEPLEQEIAFD